MRTLAKLTGITAGALLLLAGGEALAGCDKDCAGTGANKERAQSSHIDTIVVAQKIDGGSTNKKRKSMKTRTEQGTTQPDGGGGAGAPASKPKSHMIHTQP